MPRLNRWYEITTPKVRSHNLREVLRHRNPTRRRGLSHKLPKRQGQASSEQFPITFIRLRHDATLLVGRANSYALRGVSRQLRVYALALQRNRQLASSWSRSYPFA